jgi:hypothetical protein
MPASGAALLALLALLAVAAALPMAFDRATPAPTAADDDAGGDPSYDHQKVTYTAKFSPISPSASGS